MSVGFFVGLFFNGWPLGSRRLSRGLRAGPHSPPRSFATPQAKLSLSRWAGARTPMCGSVAHLRERWCLVAGTRHRVRRACWAPCSRGEVCQPSAWRVADHGWRHPPTMAGDAVLSRDSTPGEPSAVPPPPLFFPALPHSENLNSPLNPTYLTSLANNSFKEITTGHG